MKAKFRMKARKIGAIGIGYPVEVEVSGVDLEAFNSDNWRLRTPEVRKVFQALELAGYDYMPSVVKVVEDEDES